jgi:tRNA(His) 5'-end guanylyltransferase
MNSDDFDSLMRSFEWFHSLAVPPDNWIVVRVDGRSFSGFTERAGFEKPFDPMLSGIMVEVASCLATELNAVYAFTESDEISLLLPADFGLFSREVEKIVSVTAAIAASRFTAYFSSVCPDKPLGPFVSFDSRIWFAGKPERVVDYFRWRAADALRCGLNTWAYWTLRKAGYRQGQATSALKSASKEFKNELLFKHGINFNDVPSWQKRGVGLYWEEYDKEAENPITKQKVVVRRRRLKVDRDLPEGDEYGKLIEGLLLANKKGDCDGAKATGSAGNREALGRF